MRDGETLRSGEAVGRGSGGRVGGTEGPVVRGGEAGRGSGQDGQGARGGSGLRPDGLETSPACRPFLTTQPAKSGSVAVGSGYARGSMTSRDGLTLPGRMGCATTGGAVTDPSSHRVGSAPATVPCRTAGGSPRQLGRHNDALRARPTPAG